mmetsp:Transcript_9127/g.21746  ORF Transcript_9127/g.21746 Transcript_9127/m.21746 type:complete len:583 (-) Transcript_9127:119-1867(-)|eukprot:CAMPEP_0113660952 /NCGR_PEP_ID=MMETSP0017_2-20120614/33174_1 /TAXON_ID=2856 /ORGANISM="Cylindrotheca closterium" /LENGTH=582 /DNA_ID=CAMNT_0000575621 /DNA_START=263 /DNA_END=2011 /DNA_ORIENTATION=+ /assembly_acc=CAM_ASM_000147
MTDEEPSPRARKPGGSNHGRNPNAAGGPMKKRAPGSKSPPRPKKPPSKKGPQGTVRARSPTRPPSNHGSNHGRAPNPKGRGAGRGGGAPIPKGSGRTAPIPKGSGRAPAPIAKGSNRGRGGGAGRKEQAPLATASSRSRSNSVEEDLEEHSDNDEFDEDGLHSGVPPVSSSHSAIRGKSNHSTGSKPPTSIRDRARGATIRNNSNGMRSDHSRGTRSNHSGGGGGTNNDGAIIPYEESEGFESFHGDGGVDQDYEGAIVPVDENNQYTNEGYDDGYDKNKLRPPPKIKLAKEDSERGEFPHDKWWQSCLRHFRILSPHPQEDEVKKQVRYLIWTTLTLDVLVAIVSIATFGDGITNCCGTAVMAAGIPGIDWDRFMQVVTWIYLIGIFLEIHPVVREGPIPWNLLNPAFGFLISFAVFVDDSKGEAISIWIMELGSVILELVTFRKLKQLHNRKAQRLDDLEEEIANEKYSHGYRKTAFLRERRETRLVVSESEKKLRYHFVGAAVNAGLVSLTLLLIIFVARGGGLCLVGGAGGGLDIFNPDQKTRCNKCEDVNGFADECKICSFPGTENEEPDQCYFPYF